MFDKILIANRGEIACRVIKTARRMGIATVAVYSEADREALHVRMADEAYPIGPAPSAQSYLAVETIIAVCRDSGAGAVHPGYGFLSENAGFCRALEAAGIVFIGPPPAAIEAMGDKIASKRLAGEAGVNTIPGHAGTVPDAETAVAVAAGIGYPVMIKASAGGGGKGMRIARDEAGCREGFERATSEARSSFGDERVFIEKFIEEPRHIEIQVLGDAHGNIVYLGERECSVQRRHQKVLEEAPSPFLDEATRKAMGEQAVALARAVDYRSAGTVEFIVDAGRRFYFLEMNTRLQVEHPVTECVTGLDLVELMIRVGAGEALPLAQAQVKRSGWAVEARVYAEDPERGFLPSTGRLVRFRTPDEGDGVRIDTGVDEGGEVSVYYDPMIAKVIGSGPDRAAAIDKLQWALDRVLIRGPAHNVGFLNRLLSHPDFRAGSLTTSFIDEAFPEGYDATRTDARSRDTLLALAAVLEGRRRQLACAISGQLPGRTRTPARDFVAVCGASRAPLSISADGQGARVRVGEREILFSGAWSPGDASFIGTLDGAPLCVHVQAVGVGWRLEHRGVRADVLVLSPRAAELHALMPVKSPPDLSKLLLSPMPGLLVSVAVAPGEGVKAGQELAVVEAMKMENVLRADQDHTVKALLAEPGASLTVDQPIIEFE